MMEDPNQLNGGKAENVTKTIYLPFDATFSANTDE